MIDASENSKKRKKGSCLLTGCLVLFVILLLTVAGGYFFVKTAISRFVDRHTQEQAIQVPPSTYAPEDVISARRKFDELRSGSVTTPLSFSAAELNALIQENPEFAELKGRAALEILDDTIQGTISLPLDTIGYPGKFFNGKASMKLSVTKGVLNVRLVDAEVNGEKLPPELFSQLAGQNLAQDSRNKPEVREFLDKLEEVRVENGQIIVIPVNGCTAPNPLCKSERVEA